MPALPQDQLFSNMLRAALERFNSRMPEQIGHNAAVATATPNIVSSVMPWDDIFLLEMK